VRIWCTLDASRQGTPALSPGPDYPRLMYHATKTPVVVHTAWQERALGPEWSRIRPEYPKVKYHWSGQEVTVQNAEAEATLGGGWANSPSEFEAYRGPRGSHTEGGEDSCKWLEEWSVPGLSSAYRRKIKAHLLRADGVFERSPAADPESAALLCMRQVFEGVAEVLLDAGLLTGDLLRKQIPELVWDSAIAGGWWRRASETPQDIFSEQHGHYWIWREDNREARELFRAETRECEARLLESEGEEAPVVSPSPLIPATDVALGMGNEPSTARTAPEATSAAPPDDGAFATGEQRIAALGAYTARFQCSEAALARKARVDPADLSKWKKGLLARTSCKKDRIETVLKNQEAPAPRPKRD
jgi:hypothetical protein